MQRETKGESDMYRSCTLEYSGYTIFYLSSVAPTRIAFEPIRTLDSNLRLPDVPVSKNGILVPYGRSSDYTRAHTAKESND